MTKFNLELKYFFLQAYRWLKAVNKKYGIHPDINGFSTCESLVRPPTDLVFLHNRLGTQGFSPKANHWRDFQDWFHFSIKQEGFKPLLNDDPLMNGWYNNFEKEGTTQNFWEIWFMKFSEIKNIWTVFGNYDAHAESHNLKTALNQYFSFHRQEAGLHFSKDAAVGSDGRIIDSWHEYFVEWPETINRYYYDREGPKGNY